MSSVTYFIAICNDLPFLKVTYPDGTPWQAQIFDRIYLYTEDLDAEGQPIPWKSACMGFAFPGQPVVSPDPTITLYPWTAAGWDAAVAAVPAFAWDMLPIVNTAPPRV